MILAAVLMLGLAAAAQAQDLVEGARVRVTLLARPHERVVGSLLAIQGDSLAIRPDSVSLKVARADIAKLELSRGIKSRAGSGAKYGAIVGGLALGFLGVFAAEVANSESSDKTSPVAAGVAYGLAGAVVGGGLGALIMSGSHHELWEEVPTR